MISIILREAIMGSFPEARRLDACGFVPWFRQESSKGPSTKQPPPGNANLVGLY